MLLEAALVVPAVSTAATAAAAASSAESLGRLRLVGGLRSLSDGPHGMRCAYIPSRPVSTGLFCSVPIPPWSPPNRVMDGEDLPL